MTKITVHLPFPVSTNAIWRSNRGRVHRSIAYTKWQQQAGLEWLAQRTKQRQIVGSFKVLIVLNRDKRRKNMDLDNYVKCQIDFCQTHGLIENDKLCEALYIRWGTEKEAPLGARLVLRKR